MHFFLAGITGHVGGAAARTLLAGGHTLRALVRDTQKAKPWADRGVELVHGDWNDSAVLARALQGVDGAYLMMPPSQTPSRDFREAKAVVASYKAALGQSKPGKLILLSSFGSEQPSGLGLITSTHLLEEGVGNLDIPTAILRPGGFYENFATAVEPARQSGLLFSFYQPVDRKILSVASADIGVEVARLLTTEWTGKRILELGNETAPSEIAAGLAEALDRDVVAQAIPREHWPATLQQCGMPAEFTWALEEMVDAINSGHIHNNVPGTEKVPGSTSPAVFFRGLANEA